MKGVKCVVGWALIGVARFVSGSVIRWVGYKPSTRQRIYYANHSSHLDIILLWASLPPFVRRVTRPAAAHDYWGKSAFRRFLALDVLNSIMVERVVEGTSPREALASIEAVATELGNAFSLIIFPEGTRGNGEALGEFKSGVYHIAKRVPDIELIPVYMNNLNRILPKGKILPVPLLSTVTFGPPLQMRANEQKTEFLGRMRQALLELKEI